MLIESKVLRGADTIAFSNLLSKFNRYPIIIPNNYQRDYSWSRRKKKDSTALEIFLEDFLKGYKSKTKNLVLGNTVCLTDQTFHLADGQQRMTTLFIFGLYLINMLEDEEKKEMYKRDFYIIGQNLKIKQSVDTWNSKFQKTITCNYTDFDTDIIVPIVEAHLQIEKFISRNENDFDCEGWILYLLDQVMINIMYIPECNEQEYFNDVNTKGVKLTQFDILKSKLLDRCHKPNSENDWQVLISKINTLSMYYCTKSSNTLEETILTWTLYSLGILDKVSSQDLYKVIDNLDISGNEIIEEAQKITDLAIEIFNDQRSDFDALKYTNGGLFIPLYFRLQHSNKLEHQEIINYLTYLFIRYKVSNNNEVSKVYSIINNLEKISPDVKEILSDERFIYKRGANKPIKLILSLIESHLNNSSFEIAPTISLEHICSQQFEEDSWVNNLGNLTLLTKSENSKLNKEQEKYDIYKKSQYAITRAITSEYVPLNDNLRRFRSLYLKEMRSGDIDRFNKDDCDRRGEKLIEAIYNILNISEINSKL